MNSVFRPVLSSLSQIGYDPSDSQELRFRKNLLIGANFMIIAATLLWGVVYTIFGEPSAGLISLVYSVLSLILIASGLPRHYRLYLTIQLLLGLILPFFHSIILGGFMFSSVVILWSLMSPLGGLLLFGVRQAVVFLLVYFVLLVFAGFLEPLVRAENNLPYWLVAGFFVMNITGLSTIIFVMLNYFISEKNKALELLRIEEEKAHNLLLNILPKEIAEILKNENRTIADYIDGASILFADLVNFTPLTAQMPPVEMVNLLNEIFSSFDTLVEKYDLEKIRTIGDNYMVASGVPRPRPDHAQAMACMALEMINYVGKRPFESNTRIEFRIGINSGPVVGGVIGRKKFVYDLWGDAVNIASRMESQGVPGRIQITSETYELIKDDFICEPRGQIEVKGRGKMETWFLIGEKNGKNREG